MEQTFKVPASPALAQPWSSDSERMYTVAGHLSGVLISFVGPLAMLYGRRFRPEWEASERIEQHLRGALRWQIGVFCAWVLSWIFMWIPWVGWVPNALVLLFNAGFAAVAAVRCYDGTDYRYPSLNSEQTE